MNENSPSQSMQMFQGKKATYLMVQGGGTSSTHGESSQTLWYTKRPYDMQC